MSELVSIDERIKNGLISYLLIRTHDHVWNDKGWPLAIRDEVCKVLSRLSWQAPLESERRK